MMFIDVQPKPASRSGPGAEGAGGHHQAAFRPVAARTMDATVKGFDIVVGGLSRPANLPKDMVALNAEIRKVVSGRISRTSS
jgi:hypothetical protein